MNVFSPPPAAVLWDYDGTIVDTEPIWLQVEKDIVGSYGKVWTDEQGYACIGIGGDEACQKLIDAIGDVEMTIAEMNQLRGELVAKKVRSTALPYRPGAVELLDACAEANIPCALFSASPRFVVEAGVERMPSRWFQTTITGDDVTEQKPDPQGYLLAASRLGVDPTQCLVIEDSGPGCQAGRAAGAAVLAVPSLTPLDAHPGQVNRSSLVGLRVTQLSTIFAQAKASLR
ncbi:MAG: HAD family phosphatase [Propionibacteriaceae bacterium]|nr:HAD family phosphatase [Propionibacteriaceae bacterium]